MPLRESELLACLTLNAEKVVSRDEIRAHVWRTDKLITEEWDTG
ncbi:winged helix-turn-helix domain-containing protein [Spirillospora sp. NPDC047279]